MLNLIDYQEMARLALEGEQQTVEPEADPIAQLVLAYQEAMSELADLYDAAGVSWAAN